jgi:hypothetical protein
MFAAYYQKPDIVQLLVENKATFYDPKDTNVSKRIIELTDHPDIAELLRKASLAPIEVPTSANSLFNGKIDLIH